MPPKCTCVMKTRREFESQYDWLKRCLCTLHWQQTNYYLNKEESNDTGIAKKRESLEKNNAC